MCGVEGLLGRKEILQEGDSLVHLLWHFKLQTGNNQSENSNRKTNHQKRMKLYFTELYRHSTELQNISESLPVPITSLTCSVYTSPQTSCSSDTPDTSGTATTWWKTCTQNHQLLKPSIVFCYIYCRLKVYFIFSSWQFEA